MTNRINILAISGSLRAGSSNSALLKAAKILEPESADVQLFEEIGQIPLFNPDQEGESIPAVELWKKNLREADAILIASPEYGHGVPGALKNALDWVIGSGEFSKKPVALWNASARATHAFNALWEIVGTMDARLIAEASAIIPIQGKLLTPSEIAGDEQFAGLIKEALNELIAAI